MTFLASVLSSLLLAADAGAGAAEGGAAQGGAAQVEAGAEATPIETESERARRPQRVPAVEDEASPPRAQAFASLQEGMGVRSRDGAYSLKLRFLGQLRHSTELTSSRTTHGFSLEMARPVLAASLWDGRVRTHLMPEFAGGTPQLLDATAFVKVHDAFVVQVGQYRPWTSRGYRTGLIWLALPDRGPVVNEFRVDRDLGLTVLGRPFDGRFEYYFGVLNGDGKNTTTFDGGLLYTGRMVVAPLGPVPYDQVPYVGDEGTDTSARIALGANAYTVEVDDSPDVQSELADAADAQPDLPNRRDVGASADLAVYGWRLSGVAEGFWRQSWRGDAVTRRSWGAYGQVSALLVPDRFDVAMRAGMLDRDDGQGLQVPIEPGFNIYFADEHAKLQFRYTTRLALNEAQWTGHGVAVQAQLVF